MLIEFIENGIAIVGKVNGLVPRDYVKACALRNLTASAVLTGEESCTKRAITDDSDLLLNAKWDDI